MMLMSVDFRASTVLAGGLRNAASFEIDRSRRSLGDSER